MKRTSQPKVDQGRQQVLMERLGKVQQQMSVLSATIPGNITDRLKTAYKMGFQYGGDRDLYEALGYKTILTYDDFKARYNRQDIAKAIIDRPVNATWQGDLKIVESDDDKETALEKGWSELEKNHKIKSVLKRLDKLTGIGSYGLLLLGLSDTRNQDAWKEPASGEVKLMYLKPLGEGSVEIHAWDRKAASPRYGLPTMYKVTVKDSGGNESKDILVHYTRVIHIVDEPLENETVGCSRLEPVYNRLMDIEKLVGGDAEMFWRGARPGYAGQLDKDFQMGPTQMDELEAQLNEVEHNLRRFIIAEGIDVKSLAQQVADPQNHLDIQIQMIAAETGIPKRILTGSERGELSSSQDKEEWITYIESRRGDLVEARILRPVIDRFIELKILPPAKDEYSIQWEELFSISDKEKTEIGKNRAEALSKYANSPGVESVMSPKAFMRHCLALSDEEIELIEEEVDQWEKENEEELSEEEKQLMQQPPVPGQTPPVQQQPVQQE